MNAKYANGSWGQSQFNTVMFSTKRVTMLGSKDQSEKQLDDSVKCTFCYSMKNIKGTVTLS